MKIQGSASIGKIVYFALKNIIGKDTDLFIANSVVAFHNMLHKKKYTHHYTRTSKQFKIGDTKYKLRIGAMVITEVQKINNEYVSVGEPTLAHIKLSIMGLNGEEYLRLSDFLSTQENIIFEETCLVPHQGNGDNV